MMTSKVVAVIPARARDLAPDGAQAMLGGRPLLAYTVEAAKAARRVSRVLVSTDAPVVAELARSLGAEAPFLRPAQLAAPGVPLAAVLRHSVEWLDAAGCPPDIVVLLEPSHPIRPTGLVDAAVEALSEGDLDSVFAAFEDTHAFWHLDDAGTLLPLLQTEDSTRGKRRPLYRELTGLVCATRADVVRGGEKLGRRVGIVPVREFGGLADTQDSAGRRLAERLVTRHIAGVPVTASPDDVPRIPNFDTLSTLVDRLSIENVKLAHFENALEHDGVAVDEADRLRGKAESQRAIILRLRAELEVFMRDVFATGHYTYMKEERTFT